MRQSGFLASHRMGFAGLNAKRSNGRPNQHSMMSEFIPLAVFIVVAFVFKVMIDVARSKERSKSDNWFLLLAGSAFALLGLALVFLGMLAMGKGGYHGSPVPYAVLSLVGLLLTVVSGIISFKALAAMQGISE